jgi:hypothetical protein
MAKVADTILFLLDALEGWDSTGDYCLSCLFAQGLPTYSKCIERVLVARKENEFGICCTPTISQTLCLIFDSKTQLVGCFRIYMYKLNLIIYLQTVSQDSFFWAVLCLEKDCGGFFCFVLFWFGFFLAVLGLELRGFFS